MKTMQVSKTVSELYSEFQDMQQGHNLVQKAWEFAVACHEGQKHGDRPYVDHCEDVAHVVFSMTSRFDAVSRFKLIAAAYCHDVLEDCPISYNDLKQATNESIADIVYDVTNELGKNRKERNFRTYPKIRNSWMATIVKLADRTANVQAGGLKEMYKKEYPFFRSSLYSENYSDPEVNDTIHEMWMRLDMLHDYSAD